MMIEQGRPDQRDPLTGAATAAAMRRFLEAALDLSEPQGPGVVVFAVGLDDLEALSTQHGVAVAEAALLGAADRLRGGLRAHDLVGRLPEGFCVCLAEAFVAHARATAERLRRAIEAEPLPSPGGPQAVRCSIGLAFGRGPGTCADDLMARARAALGVAQAAGGGRMVVDL